MEAAGLMNNFPCLVIRGVCDYADEYKNDEWQRYASFVAASFAKEYLSCIQPVDVERIAPLSEVLKRCR
jgi:nucleoside phosphorylase